MPFRKPIGLLLAALLITAVVPAFNIQALTTTPTPTPTVTATPGGATSTPAPCTDTAANCALLATEQAYATAIAGSFKCTLSAADCALLATAQANVSTETSFQHAFTFRMNLTNAGSKPVSAQATGQGVFSVDPTVNLKDISAVYKALQFSLNISGSSGVQSGKAALLMTNGVIYAQNSTTQAWTGLDVIEALALMKQAQSQTSASQTATTQAIQKVIVQLLVDPDFIAAEEGLSNAPGWIVQKRLPVDAFLEGQRMAQIQYTYNLQALFQAPQLAVIVKKFFSAMADNLPADYQGLSTFQQIAKMNDLQLQGVLLLIGGFFGKTNIQYVRWIGEKDNLIHALNFTMNVNLIPSALSFGSSSSTTPPPPVNGTITLNIQVTKIGKPVTVTAPANATLLSERQLRQAFGLNNLPAPIPAGTPTAVPGTEAIFPPNAPTYAFIPAGTTQTAPNGSAYPVAYPYLGSPNAPIKMEEIGSFTCPYCLQYHDNVFASIQDEIKAGHVQFIYIPTTLTGDFDAHPGTYAAVCAMQQGKFWQMSDILYFWQLTYGAGAADRDRLELAAKSLHMDTDKFDSCMLDPATSSYVTTSDAYANQRGLVGTPTIFLFTNGVQMKTPANLNTTYNTPGSVSGLTVIELRRIIDAAAATSVSPTPGSTSTVDSAGVTAAAASSYLLTQNAGFGATATPLATIASTPTATPTK